MTTTTTTIYHLFFTQFWPNFNVRFLWPTIITTTTTPPTKTAATTFLDCDSIELNLVVIFMTILLFCNVAMWQCGLVNTVPVWRVIVNFTTNYEWPGHLSAAWYSTSLLNFLDQTNSFCGYYLGKDSQENPNNENSCHLVASKHLAQRKDNIFFCCAAALWCHRFET